jgi:hypothetical protein
VSDRLQIGAVTFSLVLLLIVLELVRRRKLIEEYSLLWIVLALALLALSITKGALQRVIGWLGATSAPFVVLLLLPVAGCAAALWFSVIVSRQRQQIERLTEETAILSAELRDLRTRSGAHRQERVGGESVAPSPNRPLA